MTIHFATWALGVEFGVSRVEPLDEDLRCSDIV
jgi:hypothetical protein